MHSEGSLINAWLPPPLSLGVWEGGCHEPEWNRRDPDAAAMGSLSRGHHVDWSSLLFQPRADAVLRRDRSSGAQRRDSEAGAARAVVVSMGRDVHGDIRSLVPADLVGLAA